MATRKAEKQRRRQERLAREAEERRAARRRMMTVRVVAAVVGFVVILGAVFALSNSGGSSSGAGAAGNSPFAVGDPGPGEKAPPIKLPSTDGGTYDLSAQRGETVLLYFHEGLTCQPCWDQIVDLEPQMGDLEALGVDQLVSVTTDPLDQIEQKVADEGITTPVLSDPELAASSEYTANKYGMMGESRNGHTFIAVGPDGRIEWRADYGGPPDFTMYVEVPDLVADLRAGLDESASPQG